ncbi:DUF1211 domain-containing protein [Aliikangiella coralliicola]|uniref:DUF1211 domain-containing protein n=1 Tax=Aliikangiella coralliicola TaxID=2592383 RepID=A0A545UJA7_9GAMM|nr:DUF1211 domain-containing protein [Aliikangiella coralliicola]TQV89556.1 DUF1211 domain-containing protein [Aliikangiella coralliicola]
MKWTPEQLLQLPTKDGFFLRGDNMSRVETFVAAAFAFLLTMVMVAGNEIPKSIAEFQLAVLNIPAFSVSALQIIWIWYEHAVWSRRYGLEDAWTIVLSGSLIVIVLTYVYPLKAMAAGFFSWISDGFFPSNMTVNSEDEIRFLFYFFSSGFFALALNLWAMHKLALARARQLQLTDWEIYQTKTQAMSWLVIMITSLLSILLTTILEGNTIAFAGIIYASFGITLTLLHSMRAKNAPSLQVIEKAIES